MKISCLAVSLFSKILNEEIDVMMYINIDGYTRAMTGGCVLNRGETIV